MEQVTVEKMKMMQIVLLLVALLLLLTGCGENNESGVQDLSGMAVPMSGGVDIDHFGSEEWTGGNTTEGTADGQETGERESDDGNQASKKKAEISTERVEIVYAGEDFMKSSALIGADNIYLTGFHGMFQDEAPGMDSYFWGKIGREEDTIQEFDLSVSENLFALRSCVDAENNWHVFCVPRTAEKVNYEGAQILVIDETGQLKETKDCAEAMLTRQFIPFWMAIDVQGNYFLASDGVLMWLDGEGHVKKWFQPEYLYGLGVGKSGQLYGIFQGEAGAYLGKIDPETGVAEQCADFGEELGSSFEVLSAGVNTELLLANKGNGMWSYDGERLEKKASTRELVGNGQDIMAMGFLNDGRGCVMSYEEGRYKIDYEPIEE